LVDGDLVQFAIETRKHSMFIGAPFGKTTQILKYFGSLRVKNVRPIAMNLDPAVIHAVECVACNMFSLINDHNFPARGRHAFRNNAASKSCPNDYHICVHD
jgi:hypothetical protein